ncbi:MAG: hypothetical protein WD206_06030 [Actinomycetota bacterium]
MALTSSALPRLDGSDRRVLAVVERGVAEIIGLSWGVSTGE